MIPFQQLQQQREGMIQQWHQVVAIINTRCKDLDYLKYKHHHALPMPNLETEFPIDLELMPYPAILVAFPYLR